MASQEDDYVTFVGQNLHIGINDSPTHNVCQFCSLPRLYQLLRKLRHIGSLHIVDGLHMLTHSNTDAQRHRVDDGVDLDLYLRHRP